MTAGSGGMDAEAWAARLEALGAGVRDDSTSLAALTQALREADEAPGDVPGFRSVSVGILRNVTVEPWLPALFGAFLARGLLPRFWVGDFDVFEGYAMGGSDALAEKGLDLLLVHLDGAVFAGDARFRPPPGLADDLLDRHGALVRALLDRWDGHLVVSNLAPDAREYLAPRAHQHTGSWSTGRRRFNLELVARWEGSPRVHVLDVDDAVSRFGVERAYDLRTFHAWRTPYASAFLPRLGEALAAVASALFLPPRKCLVLDLDNTLWGGILGEDGPAGLELGDTYPGSLYREFQRTLKALQDQGFLLALASKNNEEEAVRFIEESPEMVLRMEDFTAHRINWTDKAANLRELADEINIGLDSLIFIDDSDVECALVRSTLPEVQVEQFPEDPAGIPDFLAGLRGVERLMVTDDDLKRAASYRANAERARLREETTDLGDFIRSLEIELTVTKQDRVSVPRISQLTQRTNQFNLTTRRYEVVEVERFLDEGQVYTLRMADRFTDYGIIGLVMALPEGDGSWDLDTFLMSCRAFGREVEEAFLRVVLRDLAGVGAERVRGRYVPSDRNAMVERFYAGQGFEADPDDGPGERWAIDPRTVGAHGDDDRYTIERKAF